MKALTENDHKWKKVGIFGHFSDINFGNDSTFQAVLHHIWHHLPDVEITCICTDPSATMRLYGINAVSMNGVCIKPSWFRGNLLGRLLRKVIFGIPSELQSWRKALKVLKGTDALIVAGTGLLTDLCGLRRWGPYAVFKWSLVAKLRRCKLLFISVGAGPLYTPLGRWLVKSSLALADFRTYRDDATKQYLDSINFATGADRVYPDLAFSLPKARIPKENVHRPRRLVVGLGLTLYAGKLSIDKPSDLIYAAYLDTLVVFVEFLLARDYDVRLLIGDI